MGYVPAGHGLHEATDVDPVFELKVPVGQSKHEEAALVGPYCPAGQGEHDADPNVL